MSDQEHNDQSQTLGYEAVVRRGRDSYRACPAEYNNPYPLGSPEHNAFERGYWQAFKRDPIPPHQARHRPAPKSFADDYWAGRTPWWVD